MKGASKVGWTESKLSDICIVKDGTHDSPKYVDDGIPFVTQKNIRYGQVNFDKVKFISQQDHDKFYKRSNVELGDILIAMIGVNRGEVGLVNDSRIFSIKNVGLIKANTDLDMSYLLYYLKSDLAREYVDSQSRGGAQPFIGLTKLRSFPIIKPELETQKQIVAKLDQAFADIEKAKVNAEQNLVNAKELFDSYLQNVFSQKGDGWVETCVGNEINLLTGNAFKSKEYVTDSDSVKLLRGDNIMQGYFRWDGAKYWPNDRVDEFEKFLLSEGDIVLAMDRTWVKAGMKFAKITKNELPCLLLQRVARLRCKESMDKDLLYFLMGSKLFESYVLSIQTGLGVPHISGKQIQSFVFSKPDIETQKEISCKLSSLSQEVKILASVYTKKIKALDELKQSILQKAFNGELA
jgi:type I restriction enzyme S subunit